MNYIAIDTSSKNLIIVVCKDGEIFTCFDRDCGIKHSDKIMVELENLIEKTGFDLSSADFIACVTGAGSFTGIRIGVSTVKALCFANGLPFLEVTAFDTLAYNEKGGKILAVIDAGHGGFYACGYDDKKVLIPPSYLMKEEIISLSSDYQIVAEREIENLSVKVSNPLSGLISAIEDKKDNKDYNLDNLIPLYVRKSQAEEGRK